MQDNSTNDIIEMLTRYMDGELTAEEKHTTENLLKNDLAVQESYQHLLAARQAIKMQGLRERVNKIQREYLDEIQTSGVNKKKVVKQIPFYRRMMSVAAALLIIVAGYGLFQYNAATNESVYNSNFVNYSVPVSRGGESVNRITDLYSAGKYADVVQYFNTVPIKKQSDYFIAAQAYLHLNDNKAAIDNFRQVENLNNNSAEKYFVQETDYYLLLSYIKNGDINEAEKRLDKITADKQHLFYTKAKSISRIKLRILKWKQED